MAQRRDDWRNYAPFQERMNRLFEDAARRHKRGCGLGGRADESAHAEWLPMADVYETEREFIIELDLPGIERETLEVSLNDNRLTVRGERRAPQDAPMGRAPNRPFGRFLSRFGPLPASVDAQQIAAEYRDGVLRLRLPKRAEQKQGRIKINVS